MQDFYPYLQEHVAFNQKLIKVEEETFKKTLKVGQALLDEEISKAKDGKLSGEVVFKLYDTYGFPFELTQEIAEESGITVSHDEFDAEMNKLAEAYKMELDKVKELLGDREKEAIKMDIAVQKAVDFVTDAAIEG